MYYSFKMMIAYVFVFLFFGLVWCACSNTADLASERLYVDALDLYVKEDLVACEKILSRIIKADSQFYPAFFMQGKVFFMQDDMDNAYTVFEKLVKKYPQYTEARIWLIRCAIILEKYNDAESLLDVELSFNPSDWRVYYLYALLAAMKGDYEIRLMMLSRAEEHLKDSVKVYIDQARLWYALGQNTKSLVYLDIVTQMSDSQSMFTAVAESLKKEIIKDIAHE